MRGLGGLIAGVEGEELTAGARSPTPVNCSRTPVL